MDQPRVQVLEEVHVAGVEAGVVVEIIGGRDGERDIRQLHVSVPHTPRKRKKKIQRRQKRLQAKTPNFSQERRRRGRKRRHKREKVNQ